MTALTRRQGGGRPVPQCRSKGLRHAPLRGLFDPASALILSSMLKEIPAGEDRAYTVTATHSRRFSPGVWRSVRTYAWWPRAIRCAADATRLFRRIYRNVDAHILFVSHLAYDAFRTTCREPAPAPLPDGRVHIIHNSLNLPDSPPPEEPEKGLPCDGDVPRSARGGKRAGDNHRRAGEICATY